MKRPTPTSYSCSSSSSCPSSPSSSTSSCLGSLESIIPNVKPEKLPKAKRAKRDQKSNKCLNASSPNSTRRSSIYRGVTRHRWTGRFEAHLWDKSSWNNIQKKRGRQVYLGAYDTEEAAARTYDLAALKYWGPETTLNFPLDTYAKEIEEMKNVSKEEYLASLRRQSSGFSRGVSKYRGVARHHHNGRWEARIGRVFGNKYLYLGTYNTQEEAAAAYDMAALEYRGANAVTNFDISHYIERLKNKGILLSDQTQQVVPSMIKAELAEPKPQIAFKDAQPQPQLQMHPPEPEELQQEVEGLADKVQHFEYMSMQLPLSNDNETMVGMDAIDDNNELPWSFCMSSELESILGPDFPLEDSVELPNLFGDTGFEDNIDMIFDLGIDENGANPECLSDNVSCGTVEVGVSSMNMEEDNGKLGLLPSSFSNSPTSSTNSASCNYV